MKKIWNCFFFACLLTWSTSAMAQSNPSKDRAATAGEQDKAVTQKVKKPAGPEAIDELKTDADGRQYKIVDGRKVFIDSQGVQSLATPDARPKEEVKPKTDPKK